MDLLRATSRNAAKWFQSPRGSCSSQGLCPGTFEQLSYLEFSRRYEDTEYYRVTKTFRDNPARMSGTSTCCRSSRIA